MSGGVQVIDTKPIAAKEPGNHFMCIDYYTNPKSISDNKGDEVPPTVITESGQQISVFPLLSKAFTIY